jgi:phage gp45-like
MAYDMSRFFDILNSGINRPQGGLAQPRIGTVTSSDPQTATVKVLLQPEGVLSGWLPVLTQWAGTGWGITSPPSPGDQVLVISQEGNAEHGIVVGHLFSSSSRPPQVQVGEIALQHVSGSSIRLLNTGVISMSGDLHVSGDVYDSHGSLSKLRNDYNLHIHHTSSGEDTSVPIPQD